MMKVRFVVVSLFLAMVLSLGFNSSSIQANSTQPTPQPENPYFQSTLITLPDGTVIKEISINGPPASSEDVQAFKQSQRETLSVLETDNIVKLDVPAYTWVFGSAATSAGMIAAYYDQNGFSDIYTGPTNNGVMPDTDINWPTWQDVKSVSYPNNPLVATHQGVDGLTGFGSIDDYWVSYASSERDPYITANRTQHVWGDAIGDYMKTSQSVYENVDGATSYYGLSGYEMTCDMLEFLKATKNDGTYGAKLFYEARGYSVSSCYHQLTDNATLGEFTFSDYKDEINDGYPVLILLKGHSVVGVGYSSLEKVIYILDTWDTEIHPLNWGESYNDLDMTAVSIVHPVTYDAPTNVQAVYDEASSSMYVTWNSTPLRTHLVSRSESLYGTKTKLNSSSLATTFFYDLTASSGTYYYYWVQSCSSSKCGDYSAPAIGVDIANRYFIPMVGRK